MDQTGFIASIDIGTSKIIGVVGRKNEEGVTTIIASENLPSDSCVRYGVIYNIDEAAGKVRKLINLLENKIGKKIGQLYVSIAGKSLRAIEHTETRTLDGKQAVQFVLLDEMKQKAKQNKPEFFTNYSVLYPEYYLDGKLEEDPIDKLATKVEVRYRLIIGRPNIKNNLQKSIMSKAGLGIAGFVVGPVATATLILDAEDKDAGCALVDFGAGTTTVSIYKDNLLRYMSVIPFGGRTVTKDLQELGFNQEAAESYKIRYGRLGKVKGEKSSIKESDIDLRELNKVIQLREDEIIQNVIHQIKESGFADKLDAGIIITGGASQMKGLEEYLAEKSGMKVRMAVVKRVYINNASELLQNPSYTQALSMLLFGNENCEKIEKPAEPVIQPKPEPIEQKAQNPETTTSCKDNFKNKKNPKNKKEKQAGPLFRLFEKVSNFGGTMFDEDEDDK